MTIPPYTRLAQRLLIKATADGLPPSADARENAIAALEAAIVRKRRQRHWTRAGFAIAAAAAIALASVAGLRASLPAHSAANSAARTPAAVIAHPLGSGVQVIGAGALEVGGRALAQGARLVSLREGHALLHFATGSVVTLEAESELALVELATSQTLALSRGSLRAQVAKVAQGQHFVVKTPDAEITVHGTAFRVATLAAASECNAGTTTRVDVYEGVVSVRTHGIEVRVPAGQHWPQDCVTSNVPSPAAGSQPGVVAQPQRFAPTAAPLPAAVRAEPRRPADSMLAMQNDMFARAVAAQRAGDSENAVRELDLLLGHFPNTPLAQDAAVERMKWLDAIDHARAMVAARSYLAAYPQGFARAQAETILGAHP